MDWSSKLFAVTEYYMDDHLLRNPYENFHCITFAFHNSQFQQKQLVSIMETLEFNDQNSCFKANFSCMIGKYLHKSFGSYMDCAIVLQQCFSLANVINQARLEARSSEYFQMSSEMRNLQLEPPSINEFQKNLERNQSSTHFDLKVFQIFLNRKCVFTLINLLVKQIQVITCHIQPYPKQQVQQKALSMIFPFVAILY